MANSDLTPLPKSDIQVGEAIKFPVFDADGKLLLAAGQVVYSEKQLGELAEKGMFCNPRWAEQLVSSRRAAGSVKPSPSIYKPNKVTSTEDPAESGRMLRMSLPGDDQTCVVKLIGEIGKEAFLVSHPMRDNSYVFIKEGQSWEFRAFYGTSIFRFEALVEKVLLSPYPMVICTWPIETTKESRLIRSAKRVSCHIVTSIKAKAPQPSTINGVITNLSTGGLEIRASSVQAKALEKGQVVDLGFQIAMADRKFLVDAKVTIMSKVDDEDGIKLGCSFSVLSDVNFGLIHGYVMDQSVHRIESGLYAARP